MRLSKPRLLCTVLVLLTLAIANVTAHSQAFGADETILWNFDPVTGDGGNPAGGLIMDASGNLYGTTEGGGLHTGGTVFKLTPPSTSGGQWTESVLWNFDNNGTDGIEPLAGPVMDAGGNLYGTTEGGGTYGHGTVFKLIPPSSSSGSWTESILWSFGNGVDGIDPFAGLVMDGRGNLYGTTDVGGSFGGGTVFKLTAPSTVGGNWTESVLWNFPVCTNNCTDGSGTEAGLILDKTGNLYGTTAGGGTKGEGTIFKLTRPSTKGGDWTESILWNFNSYVGDGEVPFGGLIMDKSGNLYGTTSAGGNAPDGDAGTVFELTAQGVESVVWSFDRVTFDGVDPMDSLIMDRSGALYGTTVFGGAYGTAENNGFGTVFKLTPPPISGGNWSESLLWSFGNGTDGIEPHAGLIMDPSGNLYGTTDAGGFHSAGGTVFEIANNLGEISVKPTNIIFPNTVVGSTSTAALLVQNRGIGQLVGTVNTPSAPFGLSGSGGFNLAPKAQATITLTFTPTTATLSHSTDTVVSNSGQNSTVNLKVQGTGTP